MRPHNPGCSNAVRLTRASVWALARSLATTSAISVDFSSSGYLDVSVPLVVFIRPMCSGEDGWALHQSGSPIRRSADQSVCATPRSLSQLATSFFDFLCQGIHRMLLISLPCILVNTKYHHSRSLRRITSYLIYVHYAAFKVRHSEQCPDYRIL